MKKLVSFLLIIALIATFVGCDSKTSNEKNGQQSDKAPSGEVFELKLGHTGAPNHHYQEILTKFAEDVKEKTDGKLLISVFPSDQLGNQMESTEGTMLGTHDMVLSSDMVLSNWIPEAGILNLPFLFEDNDHIKKFLDSDAYDKFYDLIESSGAISLAFWDNGFRHITNSKQPINNVEDLKGLKIRVPEGEVYLNTFNALGATPTVISFGELYSALQLGTVDGQENPVAHIVTQKFYEVQKYVSKTGHIHSLSPLLINKNKFEKLPTEYQEVLVDSAKRHAIMHIDRVEELEAEQWKEVESNNMLINEVDKESFIKAVESVYEEARGKFGSELIDSILELKK